MLLSPRLGSGDVHHPTRRLLLGIHSDKFRDSFRSPAAYDTKAMVIGHLVKPGNYVEPVTQGETALVHNNESALCDATKSLLFTFRHRC